MRRRRIGALEGATRATTGDHVWWGYDSEGEQRAVIADYCEAGLDAGERVMYVEPGGGGGALRSALLERGHDVDALLTDGRLVVEATEAVYTPGGDFDPRARIDGYRRAVDDALAAGHTGFRVAAEGASLTHHEDWFAYELHADLLAAEGVFTALCAYDLRRADPEALAGVEAAHALSLHARGDGGMGELPDDGAGTAGADRAGAEVAAGPGFRLYGTPDGGIGLAGEVDLAVAQAFEELLDAAARAISAPEIDLSELAFADVAAVRAIALAARELEQEHGRVVLSGAPHVFVEMWHLGEFARLAPSAQLEEASR